MPEDLKQQEEELLRQEAEAEKEAGETTVPAEMQPETQPVQPKPDAGPAPAPEIQPAEKNTDILEPEKPAPESKPAEERFEKDKALLERVKQQLQIAQARQTQLPTNTPEQQKQFNDQEQIIKTLKDNVSRLTQGLIEGGFIPDEAVTPAEKPVAKIPDISEMVQREVQKVVAPLQQQHQKQQMFADAHDLQAKYEYFKTDAPIEEIAANPYHKEYSKLQEIDQVIAYRNSNPAYAQLRLPQVYMLMRAEMGGTPVDEIADAEKRGQEKLIKRIKNQERLPATVGDNSQPAPGEKLIERVDASKNVYKQLDQQLDNLPPEEQEAQLLKMQKELDEIADQEE